MSSIHRNTNVNTESYGCIASSDPELQKLKIHFDAFVFPATQRAPP